MRVIASTEAVECQWEPFLGWCRDHGLDPATVRSVVLEDDERSARAEVYDTDENGHREYESLPGGWAQPVIKTVAFECTPPPRISDEPVWSA